MSHFPLTLVIPSRGRPESVQRTAAALSDTGALTVPVVYALDADDPTIRSYRENAGTLLRDRSAVVLCDGGGMAQAIDTAARFLLRRQTLPAAVAVFNDDHVPRTWGWHERYLEVLLEMGTGIVYGDDKLQSERLPTQWAMTMDLVQRMGRIVPAPVRHLYADDAILDLGKSAGCIRYLRDVVVEHMHPLARKTPWTPAYRAVNAPERRAEDQARYEQWRVSPERAELVARVTAAVAAHRRGVSRAAT